MKINKKFMSIGRSSVVVIPKAWIKSHENETGKKMVGVCIDVNDTLEITPIWEEE